MEFGQQIDILWGIEIHFKNVPFEIMIIFLFVDETYFLFARITLDQVFRNFDFYIMYEKLNYPQVLA